ncbi:MAG TPA: hypothetical protein VKU90_01435 [Caulobacteraceae bacterium]|nr:hypothetical protein [Caulobacteraceae bacterium]
MKPTTALSEAAARPVWSLLVAGQRTGAPDAWRMRLVAEDDDPVACRPGQWLLLTLPAAAGALRCVGRVERFDAEELRLELALSDCAAARWAADAEIGEAIDAELVG